jgi:hypothetical protein
LGSNDEVTKSGGDDKENKTMQMRLIGLACAAALMLALPVAGQAQQKSAKQCNDEWRANRATIQKSGKLKRDFVAECRGTSNAATRTEPPQQPSQASTPPAQQQPSGRTAARPSRPSTVGTGGSPGQYADEASAKSSCAGDTVVWVNLNSKVYHFANAKAYGHTRKGTYMCERDTSQAGFRAARNERRPGGGASK